MSKFPTNHEARIARLKAMAAKPAERKALRAHLAMLASSPLRPKKDQDGHADTPLFQTTLEQFV